MKYLFWLFLTTHPLDEVCCSNAFCWLLPGISVYTLILGLIMDYYAMWKNMAQWTWHRNKYWDETLSGSLLQKLWIEDIKAVLCSCQLRWSRHVACPASCIKSVIDLAIPGTRGPGRRKNVRMCEKWCHWPARQRKWRARVWRCLIGAANSIELDTGSTLISKWIWRWWWSLITPF